MFVVDAVTPFVNPVTWNVSISNNSLLGTDIAVSKLSGPIKYTIVIISLDSILPLDMFTMGVVLGYNELSMV